jgi:hypothetical protein
MSAKTDLHYSTASRVIRREEYGFKIWPSSEGQEIGIDSDFSLRILFQLALK